MFKIPTPSDLTKNREQAPFKFDTSRNTPQKQKGMNLRSIIDDATSKTPQMSTPLPSNQKTMQPQSNVLKEMIGQGSLGEGTPATQPLVTAPQQPLTTAPSQPLAVATTQQTAPSTSTTTEPNLARQALQAYTQSLQKTAEEKAAEEELALQQEGLARGQLKIRGQAIPQDLLIGQGALLAAQGELGQQTLEQRLARLQAERALGTEAAKAQLDFETSQSTNEPIKVGDSLVQLNPETGQYETVYGAEAAGAESIYTAGSNPTVDAYVQQIQSGTLKLDNVPQDLRNMVAQGLSATPETQTPKAKRATQQADTALNAINSVLSNPAIDFSAIRRTAGSVIPGSAETDLVNQINTIKALIGFDQLQQMRDASPTGGALGQVSERELGFLQSVAGSLNINQSSEQLRDNLQRIQKSFQTLKLINSPDGTPFDIDGTTYIKQGEQLIPQDFNQVGGDTNQALNRPQRNNNPGNVKSGGLADKYAIGTDDQGHLVFPSPELGFKALQEDIQAKVSGNSKVVKGNPTIAELGKVYAEDPNWANSVARILGVNVNTRTGTLDLNKLTQAIARQEGFYA